MEKYVQFEKEKFKKSVKDNVKSLYRKTLEEATSQQVFQAADLPGSLLCGERCNHRRLAGIPGCF